MSFVEDVTIGEGESIPPDTQFTKTWRIQNTGEAFGLQQGAGIQWEGCWLEAGSSRALTWAGATLRCCQPVQVPLLGLVQTVCAAWSGHQSCSSCQHTNSRKLVDK